jgi:hypothetical protein
LAPVTSLVDVRAISPRAADRAAIEVRPVEECPARVAHANRERQQLPAHQGRRPSADEVTRASVRRSAAAFLISLEYTEAPEPVELTGR